MSAGAEILRVSEVIDTAARGLGRVFESWDSSLDRQSIEQTIRAELWFAADDLGRLFDTGSAPRDALADHIDAAMDEALRRHLTGEA